MYRPAKVTRPATVGLVPRRRLWRLLDQRRSHSVLWLSAPAGAGKTSVVATYLAARKARPLWYQIDRGDSDLATFFHYLRQAAEAAAHGRRPALPTLTPEYALDIGTFARHFFESVFRRLKEPAILVFDNYQDAPPESALHAVVAEALDAVPTGSAVIFISREEPPPAFSRSRGHGRLHVVGWDDLRLTRAEALSIAHAQRLRHLRPADIERALAVADSWAAGLVMLLRSGRAGKAAEGKGLGSTPAEVFDYLASEVFERTTAETQRLLLETSLLPYVSVSMARALTGVAGAGDVLVSLARGNYFTQRLAQREPTYKYHPLFREFLAARLRRSLAPERMAELLARATVLLEKAGQTEAAVALLVEREDWAGVARLTLAHAPELMAQGRLRTIEDWICALPESVVAADGWLSYWLGVCRMPSDLADARRLLERAFALLDGVGDAAGRLLAWCGIADSILYAWDNFADLDPWIAWADRHLSPQTAFPSPMIATMVTTSMTGALAQRQPQHPAMAAWVARSLAILDSDIDFRARLQASAYAVVYCFWMGQYSCASEIIDRLARLAAEPDAAPLSVLTWKAFALNVDHRDPETCLETVKEALELARSSGVHVLDFLLHAHGVVLSIVVGDLRGAGAFLAAMESGARGRESRAFYHFLSSWHAFLSGRPEDSERHARTALGLSVESGLLFGEAGQHLSLAELLHECGRHVEARAELTRAQEIARMTGSGYFSSACAFTEARFALGGDARTLHAALSRALATAPPQGPMHWWVPSWLATLCQKAIEAGIEVGAAQRIVRARRLVPGASAYRCEAWPWDVKIYSLGRFLVERQDAVLEFGNKAPRRLLTLLKLLVASGAKGLSEDSLADLLWPGADGDAAQQSLATSLHRLRRLLGSDRVIRVRDGRVSLEHRACWVDAHALDQILPDIDDALTIGGGTGPAADGPFVLDDLRQALSWYHGPFLPETTEAWAVSYRDRIRGRLARVLDRAAEALDRQGRLQEVADCFLRAIDADPLAEDLRAHAMRCFQRAGGGEVAAQALTRMVRAAAAGAPGGLVILDGGRAQRGH